MCGTESVRSFEKGGCLSVGLCGDSIPCIYRVSVTQPPAATRRLAITLRRGPWLGIRPTIVVEGRGQPTQWGTGTWQVPADRPTEVTVFLHWHGLSWARASITLSPTDAPALVYRAPRLPFLPARIDRS